MTDLRKLLEDSDPLGQALRRQTELDTLVRGYVDPIPEAIQRVRASDPFSSTHDSRFYPSALGAAGDIEKTSFAGSTANELERVRLMLEGNLSSSAATDILGHRSALEEAARSTLVSQITPEVLKASNIGYENALAGGALSRFHDARLPEDVAGTGNDLLAAGANALSLTGLLSASSTAAIDWKEQEMNESLKSSMEFNQSYMRQQREAQKREDAKLEYARRSAEASEENLAAANQRATAAEAGQARAEKRETRMFWITVVAVVIGAIGAGASIWALLR